MSSLLVPLRPLLLCGASFLVLALATHAQGVDWLSISNSYGQWTVDTLNTQMLNNSMTGGKSTPRPDFPAISTGEVTSRLFQLAELDTMTRSSIQRAKSLLLGKMITVEGKVRRAKKSDQIAWLEDATGRTSYRVQGSWKGRTPQLPADGSTVRFRGLVKEVTPAWVVLRQPTLQARGEAAGQRNIAKPDATQPAVSPDVLRFQSKCLRRLKSEPLAAKKVIHF